MPEIAHRCQILLLAETLADGSTPEQLRLALAAARVACVVVAPPHGSTLDRAEAKLLIELIQHHGVAALVCDDAAMAKALGADGVHLSLARTGEEDVPLAYQSARGLLGPGRIVGGAVGGSRHAAMVLGELGADYVALGPVPGSGERLIAMVEWWSEVFEVPAVAMAAPSVAQARELAGAGADFVAVPLALLAQDRASVRELEQALGAPERVS